MTTASINTLQITNIQAEQTQVKEKSQSTEQPQSLAITIACLSFFPLMYLVGKTLVTVLG